MDNLLCEIRFVEDDTRQSPGRLTGVLVNYGERARNLPERIRPGALRWPDDGIVIYEMHQRSQPIVRAVPFLDGDAVRIDAPLPNTTRGRDAATNVRERVLTGLSVEMRRATVRSEIVNGVREITYAELAGGGLVDVSEYPGSAVDVRGEQPADNRDVFLWL